MLIFEMFQSSKVRGNIQTLVAACKKHELDVNVSLEVPNRELIALPAVESVKIWTLSDWHGRASRRKLRR